MNDTPHQAAIRAAEKMTGNDTTKVFCCYPIGWCDSNELSEIITREYDGVVEDSKVLVLNLTIETCPVCNGSGRKLNAATCDRCNGCGEIVPQSIWPADLRAIQKALNQLTKG